MRNQQVGGHHGNAWEGDRPALDLRVDTEHLPRLLREGAEHRHAPHVAPDKRRGHVESGKIVQNLTLDLADQSAELGSPIVRRAPPAFPWCTLAAIGPWSGAWLHNGWHTGPLAHFAACLSASLRIERIRLRDGCAPIAAIATHQHRTPTRTASVRRVGSSRTRVTARRRDESSWIWQNCGLIMSGTLFTSAEPSQESLTRKAQGPARDLDHGTRRVGLRETEDGLARHLEQCADFIRREELRLGSGPGLAIGDAKAGIPRSVGFRPFFHESRSPVPRSRSSVSRASRSRVEVQSRAAWVLRAGLLGLHVVAPSGLHVGHRSSSGFNEPHAGHV
jgi:hypothetical protein